MRSRMIFLLLLFFISHFLTQAQYQMLVMKKESIVMRFDQGDHIKTQLKDGNTFNFRIDHIREFDFITQENDTIPFHSIKKIKLYNEMKKKYGTTFMLAGAAFGAIYLINKPTYGSKNQTSMNGLRFVSIASVVVGAWFSLTAKSQIKLNSKRTILAVKSGSLLYRSP